MTFSKNLCIIIIGNKKPQSGLPNYICKNTSNSPKFSQMCFFYWFYCLLIITTNAITKANVMIVTDTRPAKSNFIINNNAFISTIRLTSLLEANHICLFSFPIFNTIQYFFIKNNRTYNFFFYFLFLFFLLFKNHCTYKK